MEKYGYLSKEIIDALKRFKKGELVSDEELTLLKSWELVRDGKVTEEGEAVLYGESGARSDSE